MLSFLSNWIEGIAIAVIIASIFEMILPKGNSKKYVKMILGIYIVFSIISPFIDSEALYALNISDTIDEYSKNISSSSSSVQNSIDNNLNELYIETFEKQIKSAVESQGYTVISCDVEAEFDSEKDDAGIKKIYIKLSSKEKTDDENLINDIEPVEKVEINVNNTTVENENEEKEKGEENSDEDISSDDIDDLKDYLSEHFEVDKNVISIE